MTPKQTPEKVILLEALDVLEQWSSEMAGEFQAGGESWPKPWMEKHSRRRAALILARQTMLDRAESMAGEA